MEKLNLQDFVGLVARQTGWTKKESDELLRTFLSVVTEGLESDDQVKVKGLGTFKRVWIAPRQSVNIKTGEKFEIAGHYKVSFTPDGELKDLINKPYAHLATTYANGEELAKKTTEDKLDLSKLTNEAKSLMAIIDEIKLQNAEPVAQETSAQEDVAEESEIEAKVPESRKHKATTKTAAARAKVAANVAVATTMPSINEPVMPEFAVAKKDGKKKKKCRCGCIWLGICGLLLLAAAIAYYFLFAPFQIKLNIDEKIPRFEWTEISAFIEDLRDNNTLENETSNTEEWFVPAKDLTVKPDSLSVIDSIDTEVIAIEETPEAEAEPEQPQFLDEIEIKVGDTLRKLALKYYGHTMFWVYIYEANAERIASPDNVHLGTILQIPNIDAEWLDLSNPENEQQAQEMEREILDQYYY